jgi:endonuclease/exonuclease/phosphatase family metal-dependent hydrolase
MTTSKATFRVLTLNTHKGFAFLNRRLVLRDLRAAVRSVGADVVFLQEVQGENNDPYAGADAYAQGPHYEYLADEIWPQYAYGRNAVYPRGHHGNAVLSKYPITACTNHDASVAGHEGRGLLHCTLTLPHEAQLQQQTPRTNEDDAIQPDRKDTTVHVICVHLGLRESHRASQLAMLCDVVKNEVPIGEPLIVAGDFNDWRYRAHRVLERCAGLREVFVDAQGRAAKTFPAHFPLLQLDRIYVKNARSRLPLKLPRAPWSRLSDHAPLAAEIVL